MRFQSLNSKFIESKAATAGPLLVLVHGRTGNLGILEWFSKRYKTEGLSYLMVEAPFPEQREGQKDPGFSWYLNKSREGIDASREKLKNLLKELEDFGFKSEKIFFLGFSQGAAMSLDIALRVPKIFGGFICVSGLCVQSESYPQAFSTLANQQRILITHGTRDEIVLLEDTEKSLLPLKNSQIPFEFKIYDKPHSFKLNEEMPYILSTMRSWMKL